MCRRRKFRKTATKRTGRADGIWARASSKVQAGEVWPGFLGALGL
ncbi:hypothetical protein ABT040_42360 [Streptomyces sp. NPDC002688]